MAEPIIPNFPNIPITFPKPVADKTKLIVPSIEGAGGKEDLFTSAQKLANSPFKKNSEFNTPYAEISKDDLARYPNETVFESINTNPSYEDAMRNTQGEGERLWNTTKVFGANAAAMFATGLATIPNVIGSVMNNTIGETEFGKEFNLGYDSGVNKSLFDWRDEIEQGNRNYKSDWANNHWIQNILPIIGDGGFQEAVKSGGYGLGVAAEMYLTGGLSKVLGVGTGLAKITNGTAKLGGKIASTFYAADKIENAVKGIADAANTLNKISPVLNTEANILKFAEKVPDAFRLYVGAHGEASFEALEGEQRMKLELNKLYEQKHNKKAEGEDLKLINDIAKKAGQDRYLLNLGVLAVPNYLQVGKLMENFPLGRTAKSFWDDVTPNNVIYNQTTKNFGINTKGFEFKTSSPFWEKGVGKFVKKSTENTLNIFNRFPKSTLSVSEGFEELGQLYIDELTNSTYKTAYLNRDTSPTLLNLKANQEAFSKIFSKEGAESFLMGVIGGAAQQSGTKLFEILKSDFKGETEKEIAKNQALAEQFNQLLQNEAPKAFRQYLDSVNTHSTGGSASDKLKSTLATENLSQAQNVAAQANDQFNYQNLKQQNLFEFISPFIENGKLDVLKNYLQDLTKYKETDLGEFFGIDTEIANVHSFAGDTLKKAESLNNIQKNINIRYINPYKPSSENEEELTNYLTYEHFKKELGHKLWSLERFNERKSTIESALGQHKTFYEAASTSLPEFKSLINSKITTLKGEIAAINAIPLTGEAGAFNKNLEALKLTQLEALENTKNNINLKNEEEYVDAVRAVFEAFNQEQAESVPDKLQQAFDLGLLDRSIKQTELIYKALDKQSGFQTFINDREAFFLNIKKKKEVQQKIEENKEVLENSGLDDDILGEIVAENSTEEIPQIVAQEQVKQVVKTQTTAVKDNKDANIYEYDGKFWRITIKNKQKFIEELEPDGKKKIRGLVLPYDENKITLLPSSAKVVNPIKGVNVYFIADGKAYGRNTSTYENGEFTDKNYYPLKTVGGEAFGKLINNPTNITPSQSFETLEQLNKALGVAPIEVSTQDDWDVEEVPQTIDKPTFEVHPSILNLRKEGSERGVLIYAESGSGKSDFISKYNPNVPVIEADDRIVKYLQEKYPTLSFDKNTYIQTLTNAGINFSETEAENVKNLLIDVVKENKNSVVLFSNPNVLSKFTTIDLIVNKKNKATLNTVPVHELGDGFVEDLLRDGISTTNQSKISVSDIKQEPEQMEFNKFNITNLLYEIAPIKSFGTQDPVALVEAYVSALSNWELPQIPTFGFDNKENRKLARNWFSVLFKQHQIALINKLKIRYPNNWETILAENIEIIREDGGSNANLGNGLQQNGNVQRWTFVINKDFVQNILGRTYPTDFPFVLHSIKGEGGITYNGESVINLPFEKIKELGINGNIIDQKDWDKFIKQYKETIDLLNKGGKFSDNFSLEHEIYGFFTKNSPYTNTKLEDVGKDYVYNTFEFEGKNYIVYIINPTDKFSDQSVMYLLDENYNPLTVEEEIEESIRQYITQESNEVINHQGRHFVAGRKEGMKTIITGIPLKQKDFTNISGVTNFLKSNEKSTKNEITTEGIYLSIEGYRADGGLRYDPTDKEKESYKFSVKLEPYQGGNAVTINFHINKNTKDFKGDVIRKIKEQASKKLNNFDKNSKVELLQSLTDKNTAGDDLATLPYLVANSHPVQYNVDRWKLVPKLQEIKSEVISQLLPISQVVEDIKFTSENTVEALEEATGYETYSLTELRKLMKFIYNIPSIMNTIKISELENIINEETIKLNTFKNSQEYKDYTNSTDSSIRNKGHIPADIIERNIVNLKTILNNIRILERFHKLQPNEPFLNYVFMEDRIKPTETKEETVEEKVFNLLKNPNTNYAILTELPFYGISDLATLIGYEKNSKIYEKVINMQGTGKEITDLKNLIRKNPDYMKGVIINPPATRIETNNINQRVNNILASCF